LHLPFVNRGDYKTSITGIDIFVGFIHVVNFENQVGKTISDERKANGVFAGLEDLINQTRIPLEQLIILIRIGALRFTGKTKVQLLWESHLLLGKKPAKQDQDPLSFTPSKKYELPSLVQERVEDVYDEVELLGFPVKHTYFDLLETSFRGEIMAKDMISFLGKKVRMLGQLVTIKYVRTVKVVKRKLLYSDHHTRTLGCIPSADVFESGILHP
jgi:error-prone DNA polymerase